MSHPSQPKAHVATFGCQMNRQEGEVMKHLLGKSGYDVTDKIEEASLVVLETCAIRQKAEDKVNSMIGRLRKRRRRGEPDLKIAVAGCMATEESARNFVSRYDVNVVLSPRRIARIADAVNDSQYGPVIDVSEEWAVPPIEITAPDIPGLSAFVTVMQGCSNRCTFCVVPSRRGQAQSRALGDIIADLQRLAERGYKEVTLIGQNISYYGIDLGGKERLIDLLEAVENDTDLARVRFATSHPAYIDKRFIAGFGRLTRVMPHLHLPVQSGSDVMLKSMRRGYKAGRYIDIIDAIRESRPGVSVTTDIIAGFDGETESDHEATLGLIERIGFDGAYVYYYSERPGTAAPARENRDVIPVELRRKRCNEILAKVEQQALLRRQSDLGVELDVLVEKPGAGRCPRNVATVFSGGRRGEIAKIRVSEVAPFVLKGEIIEPNS